MVLARGRKGAKNGVFDLKFDVLTLLAFPVSHLGGPLVNYPTGLKNAAANFILDVKTSSAIARLNLKSSG